MHGKSGTVMVLNLSPMSEKEAENERLRDIARYSEQMTLPKDDSCGCDGDIVRDLDVVLYDNMDGECESTLFNQEQMPRFARAMGASEAEIEALQAQFAQESGEMTPKMGGLEAFKQDYADYQKFGGDTVAMELDRQEETMLPEMSDEYMDRLLGFSMTGDQTMSEAESAVSEQFGAEAMSILRGESDGIFTFAVDSPSIGKVQYVYDSSTGEGRVMRGE